MAAPQQLLKNVMAGRFKPAYYFFGVDDYRIVEAEKYVASQFLPDKQMMTNYRRLDAAKCSVEKLLIELSSLPMLGERQVLAISSLERLKPKGLKQVLAMLKPPDPNRVVIFTSRAKAMARGRSTFVKRAFFRDVSATAEVVEFARLTPGETRGQIMGKLKKGGYEIDPDALTMLAELVSGSRGGLETELDKLMNFKEPGEQITEADIANVCSGYEVFNIFELADRIVDGSTRTVLKMISKLLADGNSPIAVLTLIQQHFICLYLVKNGKKPLGNRAWMVNRFRTQAAGYGDDRLREIVISMADTDAAFRRSTLKPEIQLEMLALNISGGKK